MQHCFCFEAVDRMLQDIHNNNRLFGGHLLLWEETLRKFYLLFVEVLELQL